MYKILSLDGGGSWAIIQLKALQKIALEQHHKNGFPINADNPKEFLGQFNLIIANSGGSLALAALLRYGSFTLAIDEFSKEKVRRQVFSALTFSEKLKLSSLLKLNGIGPAWSATRKLEGIKLLLADYDILMAQVPYKAGWIDNNGNVTTHIVVCGFDFDRERALFFRSNPKSRADSPTIADTVKGAAQSTFKEILFSEAIHVASNAPVNYFDAPAIYKYKGEKERRGWDGAVAGNNNPSMPGITEALANRIDLNTIHVLSIGTANVYLPLVADRHSSKEEPIYLFQESTKSNLPMDIKKMSSSILSDPPDASSYSAYIVLNCHSQEEGKYVRMNPMVQPEWNENVNRFLLPEGLNEQQFEKLKSMDMDAVTEKDFDYIKILADAWLADKIPNQPIRTDSKLECLIGQRRFKNALGAFLNWK